MLFPHPKIRNEQQKLYTDAKTAIATKKILLAHAPTGLGKTAAVLSPALEIALAQDLTIFFLTGRHTQHAIVLETIENIRNKHDVTIPCATIISKRNLCLQDGAFAIYPHEFPEFCKSLRENDQCEHYLNTKTKEGKTKPKADLVLAELKICAPISATELKVISEKHTLCPYEIATLHAKQSKVIICDYNYLFYPTIRESFLARTQHDLAKCIVIVDEAHNLPERLREMGSDQLSTVTLERAISECSKHKLKEAEQILQDIRTFFSTMATHLKGAEEIAMTKEQFTLQITEETIALLEEAADEVLSQAKHSSISAITTFIQNWQGSDQGFVRVFTKKEGRQTIYTMHYRCLDPALLSAHVFSLFHSSVLMSGTLSPTFFYKDILGLPDCEEKIYTSPFPDNNRLSMIVPQTSTKYEERNEENYRKIGTLITHMTGSIPGNIACFFPSYALQRSVGKYVEEHIKKPILYERTFGSQDEKVIFLNRFKSYKDEGALLLGVVGANFAEGIDLPGNLLNAVIVVGLPLAKPDIETKALIAYYEKKFGNGWDYGYVLPAFTKTLQSAGRCIRTETDRGALIFLDSRYALHQYKRLFPPEWELIITTSFIEQLDTFYAQKKQDIAISKGRIV